MEQLPGWLDAAVAAAGMTTVYIAEDWDDTPFGTESAPSEGPATTH